MFPILQGARIETKTIRELLTAQPQAFAKREDPLGGRVVDETARQINLAEYMGKNLSHCRLDPATDLSSFHHHLYVPLFVIVGRRVCSAPSGVLTH